MEDQVRAISNSILVAAFILCGSAPSRAQNASDNGAKPTATAVPAPTAAPPLADKHAAGPSLVIYFGSGSSKLRAQDAAVLDRASRAYNEGKPIVMVLTGGSDRVGNANANLALSERRASMVLSALLERGIPADRFQVLAKGETDLAVPTEPGIAEAENRRVEITWR